jgi:hypothetical protein
MPATFSARATAIHYKRARPRKLDAALAFHCLRTYSHSHFLARSLLMKDICAMSLECPNRRLMCSQYRPGHMRETLRLRRPGQPETLSIYCDRYARGLATIGITGLEDAATMPTDF